MNRSVSRGLSARTRPILSAFPFFLALLALVPGGSKAVQWGLGPFGWQPDVPVLESRDWLERSRPPPTGVPVRVAEGTSGHSSKTVALCFFGLTRSLSLTHPSIQKNLIGVLESAGFEVDVFLHTYNVSSISAARTGEHAALNTTEWKLLNPVKATITSQDLLQDKHREELDKCKQAGHGWEGDQKFESLSNHLNQLRSLSEVAYLWRGAHAERNYTAVIYARPDVLFNCPFPVEHLLNIKPNTMYVPNNSHYKGVNDRFAMAAPDVARRLGNRLFYTLALCTSFPVNSELYLKKLIHYLRFALVKMDHFEFFRIRASGTIAAADLITMRGCNPDDLLEYPVRKGDRLMVRRLRERLLMSP